MRCAFVSHSSRDDSYVAELESFFRAAGFDDVFNDVSSIKPDEQFWPKIETGIAKCDTFFVVITVASGASDWVRREVECARGLGKKVVPLWVEDCPVPPIFADRDVIDLRRRSRELLRTDISRIFKYAPAELIGRDDEKKLLSDAWAKALRAENARPQVLTFVALGGEGKTSLVAKWVVDEMSAKGWPGCDAAFAWSFYSQGTREQVAASSDLFLKEALTFFASGTKEEVEEIKAFAASPAGAFEKGQRLARLVGHRRCLLILDGLEPLQYPSSATAFVPGELKDQGVAKLLKDLAASSQGLCIVTTRIGLPDLKALKGKTVSEFELKRLSRGAGVNLLQKLGVHGSERRNLPLDDDDPESKKVNEFEKLVEDVKGHALTLTLLGGFLKRAFHGDIRQRDRVKFEKADEKMDGGHAFRTMAAYEHWLLRDGGDEGRREVAVLRLMGLFDRPADAGCLAALRREPIPGLTEPLAGLADDDWEYCLSGLEAAKLLTVNRDVTGALDSLDAHPHLREYFAKQLREQNPDAWRAAHRRLYEHLCATTREGDQPTLEDLQPLYQAVAHGCQADLQLETAERVYYLRILRRDENYSLFNLGAWGPDLQAVACFFETPWLRPSRALTFSYAAWMVNNAAVCLRALGRLLEALEPMRVGMEMRIAQGDWNQAGSSANNLAELKLTLGEVTDAAAHAEQSVIYADRDEEPFLQMAFRATYADALLQSGRTGESEANFHKAEEIQAQRDPDYPILCSLPGFRYCDLLLMKAERAAWRLTLDSYSSSSADKVPFLLASCRSISDRAARTLGWVETWRKDILSPSLDRLTMGRAALYMAKLKSPHSECVISNSDLDLAVSGFHRAGTRDLIPHVFLTRAWLRFLSGARTGPESAQEDLDGAWEIAERGPMRLFLADIHLHRARLFFREEKYPWESPAADLAAAEKLIKACGYQRRDEELADAKTALKEWERR